MPTPLYSVHCFSLEEVQFVDPLLKDFRAGKQSLATASSPTATSATDAVTAIDLAEKAFRDFPSNPQKDLLQQTLFEAPENHWLTFDSIKEAFTCAGLKASQASAALRDLSWQVGQVFPKENLANLDANICIIAERMRSGGTFNYRLTKVGRAALDRILSVKKS